jgi:hypothetical protein
MHLCVCVEKEREREALYHDQQAATTTITPNKIHLLRGCDDKSFWVHIRRRGPTRFVAGQAGGTRREVLLSHVIYLCLQPWRCRFVA